MRLALKLRRSVLLISSKGQPWQITGLEAPAHKHCRFLESLAQFVIFSSTEHYGEISQMDMREADGVASLEGDFTASQNVYITSKICKEHIASISINDLNFCFKNPHFLVKDTRKNCEGLFGYICFSLTWSYFIILGICRIPIAKLIFPASCVW